MKEYLKNIVQPLTNRWSSISANEIHQASGLEEIVSLISRKSGETRPNVLHEVINLVRNVDNNHPILLDYFNSTKAMGNNDDFLRGGTEQENRT